MKNHALAIALLPAFALVAACGDGTNTTTTTTTTVNDTIMGDDNLAMPADDAMGNSMGDMAPMTAQQFADTIAASDAYEIAAGKLAQEKGTTQAVKDFGAMLVKDHSKSTADLKAAAAKATPAVTPAPAMTTEQETNLATLRDATGADFDSAFKNQQVVAHQKALGALQGYAASGEVAELKAFAGQAATVVQGHLDMATSMQ